MVNGRRARRHSNSNSIRQYHALAARLFVCRLHCCRSGALETPKRCRAHSLVMHSIMARAAGCLKQCVRSCAFAQRDIAGFCARLANADELNAAYQGTSCALFGRAAGALSGFALRHSRARINISARWTQSTRSMARISRHASCALL